jgi:hypothetical protein
MSVSVGLCLAWRYRQEIVKSVRNRYVNERAGNTFMRYGAGGSPHEEDQVFMSSFAQQVSVLPAERDYRIEGPQQSVDVQAFIRSCRALIRYRSACVERRSSTIQEEDLQGQ